MFSCQIEFIAFHLILQVIATLVVISYSTPEFIAVILPVGILYYFVQVCSSEISFFGNINVDFNSKSNYVSVFS